MSAICRLQFLKVCFKPPPLAAWTRPPALFKHSSSARGSTPLSLLRRRLSNTPKNVPPKEDVATPPPKLSLFQKFKSMYRDYWYVLVPVHVVTSVGWIGSFYYLIKRFASQILLSILIVHIPCVSLVLNLILLFYFAVVLISDST